MAVPPAAGASLTVPEPQWKSCQLDQDDDAGKAIDAAGGRCADIAVPLDHANPRGRAIPVAVSRIPPCRRAGVPARNLSIVDHELNGIPLEHREPGTVELAGFRIGYGQLSDPVLRAGYSWCGGRFPRSVLDLVRAPDRSGLFV